MIILQYLRSTQREINFASQVMEDLLEEWCVSGGHPYDLDVTSLSVALEQARLKYHAQVRSQTDKHSKNSYLIEGQPH